MTSLSEQIKTMSQEDLVRCTKHIPNQYFIFTLKLVDEEARKKLMSVLSPAAKQLVEKDLNELEFKINESWK